MPAIVEKFAAKVIATDDPQKRGRVRVTSSELLGTDEDLGEWIPPSLAWGWFCVPDVDEEIEIEVTTYDSSSHEGVVDQAFMEAPSIVWCGTRYMALESEDGARPPDSFFTDKNYGKRRGFATPGGHIIMFDDTDGSEELFISWKRAREEKRSFLSFDKDGSLTIGVHTGTFISLDTKNGTLSIVDQNTNHIDMDSTGIRVIDKSLNIVELRDTMVQVLAQKDLLVKAGTNVTLECDSVKLGSSVTAEIAEVPRFTELKAYLETHTHPTAFGPSGPPIQPVTPTIASTTTKVK